MKSRHRLCVLVAAVLLIADMFALFSMRAFTRRATLAEASVHQLMTSRVLDETDLSTLLRRLGTTVYNPPKDWTLSDGHKNAGVQLTGASPGKASAASRSQQGLAKLLDVRDSLIGRPPHRHSTLFVFFSPTDCSACLREAYNWERLAARRQSASLAVVGVVDSYDLADISSFLNTLNVTFPVLLDRPGVLRAYFSIGETPISILVDADGNLVAVSPKTVNSREMADFEGAVRRRSQEAN